MGQTQRDALLVQLLLHHQQEGGQVPDTAGEDEDDEESDTDGEYSTAVTEHGSEVRDVQIYPAGVVPSHLIVFIVLHFSQGLSSGKHTECFLENFKSGKKGL